MKKAIAFFIVLNFCLFIAYSHETYGSENFVGKWNTCFKAKIKKKGFDCVSLPESWPFKIIVKTLIDLPPLTGPS